MTPCYTRVVAHNEVFVGMPAMRLTGHVIGLLKEYMRDLVEQARQEAQNQQSFGFTAAPYRPDQAISDILAILDDRIESEGLQVGLPDGFLHQMWKLCEEARAGIEQTVWLESNLSETASSKARTRELTYRALIAYIEKQIE
jgi:hypothetical protein